MESLVKLFLLHIIGIPVFAKKHTMQEQIEKLNKHSKRACELFTALENYVYESNTLSNNNISKLSRIQLKFNQYSQEIEKKRNDLAGCESKLDSPPARNTRSSTPAVKTSTSAVKTSTPAVKTSTPAAKSLPTIQIITENFRNLIEMLIARFKGSRFPESAFVLEDYTVTISDKQVKIISSDVAGDGACCPRAIFTSFLHIRHEINLPKDPDSLTEFIRMLKTCMHDLLIVLNQNPKNQDFVRGLFSNPRNPKFTTIDEWFTHISPNNYWFTDGEIRLVAILFGLLDEPIEQINVFMKYPTEHNPYQSFNSYGTPHIVRPDFINHITIINTGGHFRSVISIDDDVTPIFGMDAEIEIPPL